MVSLAPNFEKLVNGENGIVTSIPYAVALNGGTGMMIDVDLALQKRERRSRKLTRHNFLRSSHVDFRGGGQ